MYDLLCFGYVWLLRLVLTVLLHRFFLFLMLYERVERFPQFVLGPSILHVVQPYGIFLLCCTAFNPSRERKDLMEYEYIVT